MMVGVFHHSLRHERRRADSFNCSDTSCTFLRPMHAAGVELHNTVGVRQAAVAHAGVLRIKFVDVDTRNQGVESIGPGRQTSERLLHARCSAAVPKAVSVPRGDHDRPDGTGPYGGGLAEDMLTSSSRCHASKDAGSHEVTSADCHWSLLKR